jgi:hypothetical protein
MNKSIEKWLEKLTKANEESFGTGRLDCCELNENGNGIKNSNKVKTAEDKDLKNKKN